MSVQDAKLGVVGTDLPSGNKRIGLQTFEKLELSKSNSSVVPVVVITAETIHCVGTAFCISSRGLWVTARHVVEGRHGALALRDQNPGSRIALIWVGSGLEHDVPELLGGAVVVRRIARHPASGSDLALLEAGRPNIEFPPLQLSARLPVAGTPILGLGYARLDVESDIKTGQMRNVNIEPNFHVSTGRVLQLFHDGRDTFKDLDGNFTGKLPTVCFETSARFDSGMSGGPVLDPIGSVCGVISTGLEQRPDEMMDTSFVSAMPYLFMMGLPVGDRTLRIYEMVERNLVLCDESFERLRLTETNGQIHVYYDA